MLSKQNNELASRKSESAPLPLPLSILINLRTRAMKTSAFHQKPPGTSLGELSMYKGRDGVIQGTGRNTAPKCQSYNQSYV